MDRFLSDEVRKEEKIARPEVIVFFFVCIVSFEFVRMFVSYKCQYC